jgi:hypothetical protein
MFLSSGSAGLSKPINSALTEIVGLVTAHNGPGLRDKLFSLISSSTLGRSDFVSIKEEMVAKKIPNGFEFITEFFMYIQTRGLATSPEGNAVSLETLSTGCLRKLIGAYIEHAWLLPVLMSMMTLVRKRACEMDSPTSDKWKKKIVEIFRELFPVLHKERDRLPGTCWLICQLLNLYMELDQVKLCSHILAALTQSLAREGGFDPTSVPKSVSVTLFYYWGKFHVMESKYQDAHAKLVWAFAHCSHAGNRKRIAEYLIPSMIVIGVFPKHEMISTSGLEHFEGLVSAIRIGDVESYNVLLESHAHVLAKSGTLVLMEKCKLICYRNLAKRTYIILKEITSETAKFDLSAYEAAWNFAEHASKNEAICALADLIYAGAMKGYMALEHDKLVLSKVNPFPSIDSIL